VIYIAHRGNINGPSGERENTPEAVMAALAAGFHVEVDVWRQGQKYFMGHDYAKTEVDLQSLVDSRIWCHAKNTETLIDLCRHRGIQTFFQNTDEVSLTTNGYYWCHSEHPYPGPRSILTVLDGGRPPCEAFAICSDYCMASTFAPQKIPKLIILDVDGVMTNGQKTYGREGNVLSKTFCDKDFTAIKRFKAAGVPVVLLSSDQICNAAMAKTRDIPFYHTIKNGEIFEKKMMLSSLLDEYGVSSEEVVFVGDDYYDLMLLESIEYSYCPSDAILDVRNAVKKVLACKCGEGVIAALYEEIGHYFPKIYPFDSPGVNPK
jgi:YrbI family 3-deoxy-D-manno-octulosonate 8-phosphate phosphatase